MSNDKMDENWAVKKSADEWQSQLTPEQYRITREAGTEPAFSGPYLDEKRDGTYHCVCCGKPLFSSESKYDSGTGWPSFFQPVSADAVAEREDNAYNMRRTEVMCNHCGAHLGHVFPDGPPPTHQRYCMNGAALRLDTGAGVDTGTGTTKTE
ncbi:MAG: peptide-methionine (R)-S-oxide reductase MsrB [Parvibaculales bacterium]